jgi:hypothetical protein
VGKAGIAAAKASLPLASSEFSPVCREAMVIASQTDRHKVDAEEDAERLTIPNQALAIIKDRIAYANSGSRLVNIIRHFRVVRPICPSGGSHQDFIYFPPHPDDLRP